MIPNKFVILWDNRPVKVIYYSPKRIVLVKTEIIEEITFFSEKFDAEEVINSRPITDNLIIKEIQFRIVDSK